MQLGTIILLIILISVLSLIQKLRNKGVVSRRDTKISSTTESKNAVQEMLRNAGFDEETVNMVGNKSHIKSQTVVTKKTIIKNGVTVTEEVTKTSNNNIGADQGIVGFTGELGSNTASEELDREFCARAEEDLMSYITAYNNSNADLLSKYFSVDVHKKLKQKLAEHERSSIRKVISDFDVRNSYIDDKSKHEGYKYRIVVINGTAAEFETDIHSGRIIVGDKDLKIGIQYKMTYKSKIGVGDEVKEGVCRECGAPIQPGEQSCKYCGSAIAGVDGPFIVTRIEKNYISYS